MSGFVCSIALGATAFTPVMADALGIEHIKPEYVPTEGDEAAGDAGKAILGVVAAVFIPFAAPALFGAVASSGILGAGLATAAGSAGFTTSLAGIIGSSVTAGILNAGAAYLGGARGGEVWGAFGSGALRVGATAGLNALRGVGTAAHAASAGVQTTNAATANVFSAATRTPLIGLGATQTAGQALTATGVNAVTRGPLAMSSGIVSGIRSVLGNIDGDTLNRVGAAIINAAVNGGSMGRLDGIVAQQRAELAELQRTNQEVYNQRISQAQQLIAAADRMDPAWRGRIAMADVAGMEANQSRQAMRNIATRQGGSLDSGQRQAYERSSALHSARSKALAYNRGYTEGEIAQNQARSAAAGLLGPDQMGFAHWQAETGLLADQERARSERERSTAGMFADAFFGSGTFNQAPSPSPSGLNQNDDDEDNPSIFNPGGPG